MWFDTIANYEMDNEDIRSLLEDIAYDNKEYFCPDDLIDDCNSAVVYFGVSFSPSEIIKNLIQLYIKQFGMMRLIIGLKKQWMILIDLLLMTERLLMNVLMHYLKM